MSSQEDGYGRTFAANERMARRGPSHHKNHVREIHHSLHQLARPTKVSVPDFPFFEREPMAFSILRDLQACAQATSDSQGTSHSLLRTPLFGSAVPRRQRTGKTSFLIARLSGLMCKEL